jgi:hypothetical protein
VQNLLKENWLKLIFAVVLLAIGSAAVYYFAIFLPSTYKGQSSSTTQASSTATFSGDQLLAADQQCSQSAYQEYLQQGRAIEDFFQQTNMGISYSDHFNPQLVKCYMKLDACYPSGGSCKSVEDIYDVYDNQEILGWSSITDQCSVNLSGQPCLSKQQYDSIVAQYFGTAQQTTPQ